MKNNDPIYFRNYRNSYSYFVGWRRCGNAVLNKTIGNNSGWLLITTGWALAVYVAVVISVPYSEAHINPAVSLGLAIPGKFPWRDMRMHILGQMIGAMIGSLAVWVFYKSHFDATEDGEIKKAVFFYGTSHTTYFFKFI